MPVYLHIDKRAQRHLEETVRLLRRLCERRSAASGVFAVIRINSPEKGVLQVQEVAGL